MNGMNGSSMTSDALFARQDAINAQKQSIQKTNELVEQDRRNAQLNQDKHALIAATGSLAAENARYKEMLARPLQEILDENANLKNAVEEQKQLIALWMLRQRAIKKVVIDIANENNIDPTKALEQSSANMEKIIQNNSLNEFVSSDNMEYFQEHKNFLMRNIK